MLLVLYVIVAVGQVTSHHFVQVAALVLCVRVVEVVMFVLGFPLLVCENFRELFKVSLELLLVLMAD